MNRDPYLVERVRGAMQERSRSQACLYKSFLTALSPEKAEELAREGIREYGRIRARLDGKKITPEEWVDEHYKKMGGIFNSEIFKTDEYCEIHMKYCPHYEEWKRMGLSENEVDLFCDIAMELDRERAKQHGIPCDIKERIGKGDSFCRVTLWKNKKD